MKYNHIVLHMILSTIRIIVILYLHNITLL